MAVDAAKFEAMEQRLRAIETAFTKMEASIATTVSIAKWIKHSSDTSINRRPG